MQNKAKIKILLSTGGTGGHVIPAVNLGNFFLDKGFECSIILDKRGEKYINKFKGKYYLISSGHLSSDNFFLKILNLFKLIIGLFQSLIIFIKFKPKSFISFGGYSTSMPILIAIIFKIFFKINFFIHEQNSVVGKVNLFFLPFVDLLFTNFDIIQNLKKKYLRKKIYTGLPNYSKKINKSKINYNKSKKTIFVYGGSQGSEFILKKLISVIGNIEEIIINKIEFIIQSPKEMIGDIQKSFKEFGLEFTIQDFYLNIDEILNKTDLALTRSGAGTIDDLIKYSVPSILFPLPNSIYNHQFFNAKYLGDKNCAIIIEEKSFNFDIFKNTFTDLLKDNIKIDSMRKSLKNINLPDANIIILERILNEKK